MEVSALVGAGPVGQSLEEQAATEHLKQAAEEAEAVITLRAVLAVMGPLRAAEEAEAAESIRASTQAMAATAAGQK
jgi:precorrin-6B methylase 1